MEINFYSQIYIIFFQVKKSMGQEQFTQLRETISMRQNTNGEQKISTQEYLISILKQFSQKSQNTFTPEEIRQHILAYLNAQIVPEEMPRKRSRSYELLQMEPMTSQDDKMKNSQMKKQSKTLEERMQWLQQIESKVRRNITQLMVTQKPYKIRQSFRKLALHLLNLQNFLIYIVHPQGRLQFHDFKNNYITDIIESQRSKSVEQMIGQYSNDVVNPQILKAFDISNETNGQNLNKWGISKDNKVSLCFLWKKKENKEACTMNKKIAEKLANMAMISTSQQEISIIQVYSKDLLELLQFCINQYEQVICKQLGSVHLTLEQTEKQMLNRNEKDETLMTRINVYQQIQFQLLERIRLYKKYVCEDNKIFMDFNEEAELTFCSHNFNHQLTHNLSKLFENENLVLQKIFENYKPINDFLKKAVQQKLKNNKLYELDFQSKARVTYDTTGKIIRLNVILEELQNSSNSSSSNIYCSSSTKILSEQQQKRSLKDVPGFSQEDKSDRKSTLIRTLQKDNPGITNQGWINLFIKDHHIPNTVRKNTHLKSKAGKTYTVKRSFSLDQENLVQSNDPKDKAMNINVESIDLNLLEMDEQVLEPLVLRVFRKLEYFHSEHVHKQSFENFLSEIHKGYQIHNNPFHNFTHGVNVMHTCYLLSHTVRVKQLLSPFKIFSVVFSGLCHDVGHTGFTNLFEIASRSKKAITYNDCSPLQNFHAAYTFQLLKKPENNFLKDVTPEELKDFRKSVINNILFTDIKEHFPLLKKFNALIKDQLPKNDEYLNILTAMIVHTSDFGGSAKEFEICKSWSLKVNLQFSNQYKMEGQLSLPQTPFMKDLNNVAILSKNEGGFLKVIVFPLYEALDEFCGTDLRIRKLREYVETNIRQWQQIYSQSQNEEKKDVFLENKKE